MVAFLGVDRSSAVAVDYAGKLDANLKARTDTAGFAAPVTSARQQLETAAAGVAAAADLVREAKAKRDEGDRHVNTVGGALGAAIREAGKLNPADPFPAFILGGEAMSDITKLPLPEQNLKLQALEERMATNPSHPLAVRYLEQVRAARAALAESDADHQAKKVALENARVQELAAKTNLRRVSIRLFGELLVHFDGNMKAVEAIFPKPAKDRKKPAAAADTASGS